jgi:predicted TPR repeat methyltransferase
VKLVPTLRYAHGAGYLRSTLGAAGFTALLFDQSPIRTERGEPVDGLTVVASSSDRLRGAD